MSILERRKLVGHSSEFAEIEVVGGLFIVPSSMGGDDAVKAVKADGIRALEVQSRDLSFLEGLDVEFLSLNVTNPYIGPVNSLTGLRGLSVDSWVGDLDLTSLPRLEWCHVTEVEKGQLDPLRERGHASLHHVSVGRYEWKDLTALERIPDLVRLDVVDSRSLAGLAGIGELHSLAGLELSFCRALESLDGLGASASLQYLGIDSCNRIGKLDPVSSTDRLRMLRIDSRKPPSLAPLANHRSLEHVWVTGGPRPEDEIEALTANAALRSIQVRRDIRIRTEEGWVEFDIYDPGPHQDLQERISEERTNLMVP